MYVKREEKQLESLFLENCNIIFANFTFKFSIFKTYEAWKSSITEVGRLLEDEDVLKHSIGGGGWFSGEKKHSLQET